MLMQQRDSSRLSRWRAWPHRILHLGNAKLSQGDILAKNAVVLAHFDRRLTIRWPSSSWERRSRESRRLSCKDSKQWVNHLLARAINRAPLISKSTNKIGKISFAKEPFLTTVEVNGCFASAKTVAWVSCGQEKFSATFATNSYEHVWLYSHW